ncbi:RyR domain-containing protein [Sphaerisporangium sp. B11E5]|uniref:RyR domain-containing protein n=1 Tax=Sphaerisporangium sp. B11E5 TaxID=3153563 RepID=UPI00325C4955
MPISATNVVRVAFGILAVVALVTGYVGLDDFLASQSSQSSQLATGFDLLYWDIQLFVLDSVASDGGQLPATLQFARFAAPAVTIFTLVDGARLLFAAELRRIRARESRDHVVVCGSGAVTIALVERLRENAERVVVISSAPATAPGDRRVLHVSGDARNPATLRAAGTQRATRLYACEADSSTNTAIALAAHSLSRRGTDTPLSAYAYIPDPDLCAALRARRLSLAGRSRLRLDFFNLDELAARVLLERHPVLNDQPIVVMGLDTFGCALLVEVAKRRRLDTSSSERLPITVVDDNAAQTGAALCRRFEFLPEVCEITFHDAEPDDPRLAEILPAGSPQRVFVCYADQDLALKTALTSIRLWCCGPGSLIVRVEQAATFGRAFQDVRLLEGIAGALHIFAINEEAGDPRLIGEDLVETLARAIHDRYLLEAAGRRENLQSNTSMASWERLPDRLKNANRRQAEDIGRKLASIGCALAPRVEPGLAFSFKEQEIERLAVMEHDRWLTELVRHGWTQGPERDSVRLRHPDLDRWENLSEVAREKDRDTVRNLPCILSDAGFQIVRIT